MPNFCGLILLNMIALSFAVPAALLLTPIGGFVVYALVVWYLIDTDGDCKDCGG